MLALADDAALARLVIAATAIPFVQVYPASKLSDRAVEGMPVRPRTVSERLISLGHAFEASQRNLADFMKGRLGNRSRL